MLYPAEVICIMLVIGVVLAIPVVTDPTTLGTSARVSVTAPVRPATEETPAAAGVDGAHAVPFHAATCPVVALDCVRSDSGC